MVENMMNIFPWKNNKLIAEPQYNDRNFTYTIADLLYLIPLGKNLSSETTFKLCLKTKISHFV